MDFCALVWSAGLRRESFPVEAEGGAVDFCWQRWSGGGGGARILRTFHFF
jgi:hypothetical protein